MRPLGPRALAAAATAIFVAGLLAGGVAVWFMETQLEIPPEPAKTQPEVRQGGFRLINPLLECDVATTVFAHRELERFEDRVEDLVERVRESGRAHSVSVYFRDLNNGPWFGINENERFAPASLLKLPVLISYLKIAESDPAILTRRYTMTAEALQGLEHLTPNPRSLVVGQSYAVGDLLRQMILFSDNQAARLLIRDPREHFARPFIDLKVPLPGVDRIEDYMTVKQYASFFRILYNASYLTNAMSQEALQLMTQSDFRHGLVEGVPAGVLVSHKYGELAFAPVEPGAGPRVQFHDCGIVYAPQRPYLLCVMTRGDNLPDLIGVIRDVSREVYVAVESQSRR